MRHQIRLNRLLHPAKILVVLGLMFVSLTVAAQPYAKAIVTLLLKGCRLTDLERLPVIDCDNKGLTSLPKDLPGKLFNLQLPNNHLSTVPCLGLPYLHRLNLSNNTLTDFPWACLTEMPRLAYLDLSYNQLSCVKLFPVRFSLRNLKTLDISFNRLKTLSWCDLGLTFNGHVPYGGIIAGNPFHCDCDIAWLVDMAKIAEQCRLEKSFSRIEACLSEIETNALIREFHRAPFSFRCKTPPKLVDVELYRLDISACRQFWDRFYQNETQSPPDTCPLDDSCPTEGHSDVTTSSLLPPINGSSELAEPKRNQTEMYQNFPKTTIISNVINATLVAARTSGQIKVSSETFTPLDKGTHTVPVTEMPKKSDKSFEEEDTLFSGWMLTTIVVVLIVAICAVVLGVYCIMVRIQAGKTVPVNTNLHPRVNDKKSCPSVDSKPDSDATVYEHISDEEEEPYAKSYVFDIPQYEMTKI